MDVCSESPLHLAAKQGYTDILCKHGPSVNATKTHCCENNVDHDMHFLMVDGVWQSEWDCWMFAFLNGLRL